MGVFPVVSGHMKWPRASRFLPQACQTANRSKNGQRSGTALRAADGLQARNSGVRPAIARALSRAAGSQRVGALGLTLAASHANLFFEKKTV